MTDYDEFLRGAQGEAFQRAVVAATERATQNVSQVHRRRLVRHSAISTAMVMAIFGILIIVFISNNNGAQQRLNSRFNCALFANVARVMSNFVKTEADLRKQQALDQKHIAKLRPGALKSLFQDPQTVRLSASSAKVERETIHYWETSLIPSLRQDANVNCTRKFH